MPKTITKWKCSCCNHVFDDYNECFEHEATTHHHLSVDDFRKWERLTQRVRHTSYLVYCTKNKQTDAAYDKACEDLTHFEQNHHLSVRRNPFQTH